MACRPQSNPSSISSDGVPPELLVLGLRRLPGVPVRYTGQTGRRREAAGVDRFDDLATRSSAFECVTRFCVNTLFGDSAGDRLIWFQNISNLVLEEDGLFKYRQGKHHHGYAGGAHRRGAQGLPSCGGARLDPILEGLQEGSCWPCQEG